MTKFKNEIKIMRILDHPNIVNLYYVYEEKELVILVLELIEGGGLFNRIQKKQRFSQLECAIFLKTIHSDLYSFVS